MQEGCCIERRLYLLGQFLWCLPCFAAEHFWSRVVYFMKVSPLIQEYILIIYSIVVISYLVVLPYINTASLI